MPIETERFQDFCRKYINRKVREHFKDLGDDRWQPDFNVDRHVTRWICTHQDKDPLTLTVGRLLVYFFKVQGLLDEPIFAMPCTRLEQNVQTIPQIIIRFQESARDARANKRYWHPLRAEHYVRVKEDFTSESDVQQIARKVREVFATPVFSFDKGRTKFTYHDKIKGHLFIVASTTESEARDIIQKLLTITNEMPNWNLLTESKSNQNFEATEYITVNGKRQKKPQRRPVGKVHFISAELHVNGLNGNIQLIDLTGRSSNAILPA